MIHEANQKNYSVSIKSNFGEEEYTVYGIEQGNHYAIIASANVIDSDGNQASICKLRNPWKSDFEWEGAWSDKSTKWTEQLKKELNVQEAVDGVFWMCWPDLMKYFNSFIICKARDDCIFSSVQSSLTRQVYKIKCG